MWMVEYNIDGECAVCSESTWWANDLGRILIIGMTWYKNLKNGSSTIFSTFRQCVLFKVEVTLVAVVQ